MYLPRVHYISLAFQLQTRTGRTKFEIQNGLLGTSLNRTCFYHLCSMWSSLRSVVVIRAIYFPYSRLCEFIGCLTTAHIPKSEILLHHVMPIECMFGGAFSIVPSMAFDVVYQDTESIKWRWRPAPRESDVRWAHDGGSGIRQRRVEWSLATKRSCRLHDGVETPARSAIDEQTDQDPLIQQTGSGLWACAWK